MSGSWLGAVSRRDPSVSLTLAALVRAAGPHGASGLPELLQAYRETFLLTYRDLVRGNEPDLSETEIRDHLQGSLLPRLAHEGWIDDTAAIEWEAVQAVGEWWLSAAASRAASFDALVHIARESVRFRDRAPATTSRSVLEGTDLFVGLSGPGIITAKDLQRMNPDPFVFAMANPNPEVKPEDAAPYVRVMATGRSDYPNQINNVLAFPGIFRGAFDVRATAITEEMKLAAARGIASVVGDDELDEDYIIPSVFNRDVAREVASAVAEVAERGDEEAEPEQPTVERAAVS